MSSLFDDLILPGFGPGGPRAGALGDDSERAPGAVGSRRDDEVGPDGIPGWSRLVCSRPEVEAGLAAAAKRLSADVTEGSW